MKYIFPLIFSFIVCNGCGNNQSKTETSPDSTANRKVEISKNNFSDRSKVKVYINAAGTIAANGNIVSLTELDSSLSRLKRDSGIVFYSRENGRSAPTSQAMSVMQLILKHELPVQLYTDSSFTNVVDL